MGPLNKREFEIGFTNTMGPLPLNNGTTTEHDKNIIASYKEVFDNDFTNKVYPNRNFNDNKPSIFIEMVKYKSRMRSYLENIEPTISNPLMHEMIERTIKRLNSYNNIAYKNKYEESMKKYK